MKKVFDIGLLKDKVFAQVYRLRETIIQDNKKLILFCFCVALFLFIDTRFLLVPQIVALRNAAKKITRIVLGREYLNKNLLIIKDFEQKQSAFGKDYFKPKRTFYQAEQPVLLELVSTVVNNNNLKLMQINVGPKEPGPAGKFIGLVINLELYGDYHALGKFLNELESTVANVNVSNMRIASDPQDIYREKITLVLKVYAKK
ncbi:MAG: type 4a pilus biogenesis protein PilO [Candidatus Omnitrophica bacterium]|nr:type 4a pilus biogenesis protein PilO [Candidatus Omnitrophota bacterium]